MIKRKRRTKSKNALMIKTATFFSLLLLSGESASYALFSETLTIAGTATSNAYITNQIPGRI